MTCSRYSSQEARQSLQQLFPKAPGGFESDKKGRLLVEGF